MIKKKAVSLFSSAGIGELLLHNAGIEVVVANELIKQRSDCYSFFYPQTKMINGDISEDSIKKTIISEAKSSDAKILIATPPCQGLSSLGKNKLQGHFEKDERNFLVFDVFQIIEACEFDYILIENVPIFLKMLFPYKSSYMNLEDILNLKYGAEYSIETKVLNSKDYGISQSRPRAIIKLYRKGTEWPWPNEEKEIPLKDAIGYLPSLDSGESSDIKWHYAKKQSEMHAEALKHTPTGMSAINNEVYYPKKKDGTRIKGFHNTYKRMSWDSPCPARTTYSGSISSHNNVHPGRKLSDGTYSDARVLTLLETFIVSSIPQDIDFPKGTSDTFIRTVIGESIPPKLLVKIFENIGV